MSCFSLRPHWDFSVSRAYFGCRRVPGKFDWKKQGSLHQILSEETQLSNMTSCRWAVQQLQAFVAMAARKNEHKPRRQLPPGIEFQSRHTKRLAIAENAGFNFDLAGGRREHFRSGRVRTRPISVIQHD